MRGLLLVHTIVGKPEELTFDPERAWRACLICGIVFQHPYDRLPLDQFTPDKVVTATIAREEWARKHARTHSSKEHELLKLSGMTCTPEAVERLTPMGIAPVSDMVISPEHAMAALEAPRLAKEDSEW